jgi:hypothetical protein
MCPSSQLKINNFNEILKNKSSKKYIIKTYKILCKNKNIQFMKGYTHDVNFINNNQSIKRMYMNNPYFLIHFSYRGIQDCYYKCIYQNLINHKDAHLNLYKYKLCNNEIEKIKINELPSRVLVFLGEICNKNIDLQINIILPIFQKTQYELYELFDNKEDNYKNLFINRILQIIKLDLYKNIFLPNNNIKNYIKNISLNNNIIIKFEKNN